MAHWLTHGFRLWKLTYLRKVLNWKNWKLKIQKLKLKFIIQNKNLKSKLKIQNFLITSLEMNFYLKKEKKTNSLNEKVLYQASRSAVFFWMAVTVKLKHTLKRFERYF